MLAEELVYRPRRVRRGGLSLGGVRIFLGSAPGLRHTIPALNAELAPTALFKRPNTDQSTSHKTSHRYPPGYAHPFKTGSKRTESAIEQ